MLLKEFFVLFGFVLMLKEVFFYQNKKGQIIQRLPCITILTLRVLTRLA